MLYGNVHGILTNGVPPQNAYTVSCFPWIEFSHFAVHLFENKNYYFPSIEAGKFIEKEGQLIMPLSITCHHATTAGYHIKCFLDSFYTEMDLLCENINCTMK